MPTRLKRLHGSIRSDDSIRGTRLIRRVRVGEENGKILKLAPAPPAAVKIQMGPIRIHRGVFGLLRQSVLPGASSPVMKGQNPLKNVILWPYYAAYIVV